MNQVRFIQVAPEQLKQLISEAVKQEFEEFRTVSSISTPSIDEYLTRKEAAKELKISISTLHNWVKRERLQSYGIEGRVYFKRSEIEQAMIKLN